MALFKRFDLNAIVHRLVNPVDTLDPARRAAPKVDIPRVHPSHPLVVVPLAEPNAEQVEAGLSSLKYMLNSAGIRGLDDDRMRSVVTVVYTVCLQYGETVQAPTDHVSPALSTLYEIKKSGLDDTIEKAIFEQVVRRALYLGCTVSLQDGLSARLGAEEVLTDSTNFVEIIRASRTTDADVLILKGPIDGWIAFVWGNGAEVIHDHSTLSTMTDFVDSFDRMLERLA